MLKTLTNFIKANKYLVGILIVAAFLRFFRIGSMPPSLNWDEISHGYNAYSILKTGRDEWGELMPLIFRAYGDYKLPVYIYFTSLSEAFFGLNSFAVRLPSVLAGLGTVLFTYLLTKELFRESKKINSERLGLVAALLVAIEPWSFFLSRGAFEANLALFFIVAGVYCFLRGTKEVGYLFVSAILLGLSVWTYNSARVFVPLFIPFLVLAYRIELAGHWLEDAIKLKAVFFALMLFVGGMFVQLVNPVGQARYNKVSIIDEGAIAQIEEARNTSELSPEVARLIHNKATFFALRVGENWVSHFDGAFLFFEGGSQYQFSIPGRGLIYGVNALFMLIGVVLLVKERKREGNLILIWFFLGPLASSITREAPHVLRSITMLPAPMIITAFGLVSSFKYLESKLNIRKLLWVFVGIYGFVLYGSLEIYMTDYFTSYKNTYSWSWQYGYEQAVNYARNHYDEYDKIIMTKKYGEPHEFVLFFNKWNPSSYRNDEHLIRFSQSDWFWVDGFDKYIFVNDWEVPQESVATFITESGYSTECIPEEILTMIETSEHSDRCLFIGSPGNAPEGWEKLETIDFLDSTTAFELYRNY